MESETSKIQSEYDYLMKYEIELFKNRWLVFTTLLSISFIITGLGLRYIASEGVNLLSQLVCILGAIVYFVGTYHYWWFHNKAHALRSRLIELEKKLGFQIYQIREESRQSFLGIKLKFHWVINFLTLVYVALLFYILVFKLQ